jgi:hypothetical protein
MIKNDPGNTCPPRLPCLWCLLAIAIFSDGIAKFECIFEVAHAPSLPDQCSHFRTKTHVRIHMVSSNDGNGLHLHAESAK